jgi:antibiotic biosynthesis monooxygenase (ABM) superfamily enzyme
MNAPVAMLPNPGATAVITHRIRPGRQAEYEALVGEITPLARLAPGYLDLQWVRPIPGLTHTNTIILRFSTEQNLREWMTSVTRTRWIEKVTPLFVTGDAFVVRSGLDFLFASTDARAPIPPRWKQFLLTWSAIFPLSLCMPFVVRRMLSLLHIPGNLLVTSLVGTGVMVFLMVYVVMPRYTKLVKRWLSS